MKRSLLQVCPVKPGNDGFALGIGLQQWFNLANPANLLAQTLHTALHNVQDVIRLKALGLFLDRFARKVYAKLFHDFSVNFRKHHRCVHLRAFKLGQLVYGDLCILIVF